jgi:hypothetical protein
MYHTDARDLYQRRRELPPSFASGSEFTRIPPGFFTCRKAGTWDILFYFPSEGRHTENFSDARKIQRPRPGLKPLTRVPVASMLTSRPRLYVINVIVLERVNKKFASVYSICLFVCLIICSSACVSLLSLSS